MVLKEYMVRGMVNRVLVLTPATMVGQWLEELDRDVQVYVYHVQPSFRSEILAELKRLRRPALHVLEDGTLYRF